MQRLSYLFVPILLLSLFAALAGCGGGGGGETSITATGPATGDTAAAAPPAAGPQAAGVVTLAWDAPIGENGKPVPDLAGYRVSYGTAVGSYATTVDIGTSTSCTVSDLPPGTYYFTVTAYDSTGNESEYSNEASYTIAS